MRTDLGHRMRVKERFQKEGLDNFNEVHALELLLFYAIPRKDTKPVARRLLDKFGSFAKVLEATPETLQQVEGVGANTALYIKLMHATGRYFLISQERATNIFNDINDCGSYLIRFFHGKREESVWVLCLDAKRKMLSCQKISEGGMDSVAVSPRRVMEVAISVNATSVILAHNHPGGTASPSTMDIAVTQRMAMGLHTMGVILVDHIVVAENDFTSMLQTGNYRPEECRGY